MQTVLITSQKDAFCRQLAKVFRKEGYNVFIAGTEKHPESIDIYIDVSDNRSKKDTFSIRDGLNEKVIKKIYKENVIKPMLLLEKYLPLTDKGSVKRLCFLSSRKASINETADVSGFAYKMSKAAMHNLFMITWNTLEKDGYTFRVFDPMLDTVDAVTSAKSAFTYFTRRRGTENDDPMRDDENRLVMRDAFGIEHAW